MLQCNFIGGVFIFKRTSGVYVNVHAHPEAFFAPHVVPPVKTYINYKVVSRVSSVRRGNISLESRSFHRPHMRQ